MKSVDWLAPQTPLRMADAVAAILIVDGERYLMQLRDDLPHIWFPGHWGTFGGAVDAGESEMDTLRREIKEELDCDVSDAELFGRFHFDLTAAGLSKCFRSYYVVHVTRSQAAGFVLAEGAAMKAFTAEELFTETHVAPYDGFAIFLHARRGRMRL